jgi:hypothetical protein
MALLPLNAYSSLRSLPLHSSSYTHAISLYLSPLSFATRIKPHKTLLIPCSSPAFSPIVLSRLETHQSEIEHEAPLEIEPCSYTESDPDPGPDSDPDLMIDFLKDQISSLNLFQDPLEELNDITEIQLEENGEDQETGSTNTSMLEKILDIARNSPENVTFEEQLRKFVGIISEEDCVSLLEMLSKEGLLKECLYLVEWMRVQDPVLVTPRAFLVVFPALGHAHLSEEILDVIRNLPQEKRFRAAQIYNSAILGLAKCGRLVMI